MKIFFTIKGLVVCCLFLLSANEMYAQSGQWTWMGGDSTINNHGVFGTLGISAATNKPGGRFSNMSWTDSLGNFWLFGGVKLDSIGNGFINDLWKYNSFINEWTWIKGDSTFNSSGIYGTKGVPAINNKPGARNAAVTWTDSAGYLWLFGGQNSEPVGNSFSNDLWKYDAVTNKWTWMNGNSSPSNNFPSYGTQGVSSPTNNPGGRWGSVSWSDGIDNLWLYGGSGNTQSGLGDFNDLWKYNIIKNEWTWMKGDSILNKAGVYGTQGFASASGNPGGRLQASSWIDSSKNFWLFGGVHYTSFLTRGALNDLWKYNISLNQWIWVKGDSILNALADYGTIGLSASNNKPGARTQCISWTDKAGKLLLFGGSEKKINSSKYMNTLWEYNIGTNNWTWIKGDTSGSNFGQYGNLGVASQTNNPGSRGVSSNWTDASGDLWLFGGVGYAASKQDYLSDLWKFSFDTTTLPVHLLTFTARLHSSSLSFGEGRGEALLNWTVENEQSFDRYEVERSYNGSGFSKIGSVSATSARAYSYTDNNPTITPNTKPQTIYYHLKMIDRDGKFTYSKIEKVSYNNQNITFNIFPNPATDKLQLQVESDQKATLQLQVLSQDGKILMTSQATVQQGTSLQSVNISKLQSGHYFLKVLQADHEAVVLSFEKAR